MLAAVGISLLREDAAPLPLNAINEATIAALYRAHTQVIQVEIKMDLRPEFRHWRRSTCVRIVRHDVRPVATRARLARHRMATPWPPTAPRSTWAAMERGLRVCTERTQSDDSLVRRPPSAEFCRKGKRRRSWSTPLALDTPAGVGPPTHTSGDYNSSSSAKKAVPQTKSHRLAVGARSTPFSP